MSLLKKKKSNIQAFGSVTYKNKDLSVATDYEGNKIWVKFDNIEAELTKEEAKNLRTLIDKALDVHTTSYYNFD